MERRAPRPSAGPLLAALLLLLVAASATAHSAALAGPGEGGPGKTAAPCSLAGTWVNELGSRVVFSAANEGGAFSGSYLTAVTASDAAIRESPLQGTQDLPGRRAQPAFGFTVRWSFTDSVTVFAGQCFVGADGEETLQTTWLLRKEVETLADDWKATLVGRNVFTRVK